MEKLLNVFINVGDSFKISESFTTKLKLLDSKIEVTIASDKSGDSYALENAEIIWGWLKDDQFAKAKNLKWLQLPNAGFDRHTDKSLYCNSDIRLTNSRGVSGVSMAEHVLGLIISFNRNLHCYARFQTEKRWSPMKPGKNIIGSTVGIVGLGDIGSEVAKRMHALGAIVIAVKRSPSETPEYVSELFFGEEGIDSLVKKSDYIILTLPATSKTKNIISEARLKSMKPGCFIVNVGRGTLIDQEALIKALNKDWIGGAGLDVTTPEPLPSNNPLWGMHNVIITPHVSGGVSVYNKEKILSIFKENLKRYINGKPLINMIDFSIEY